LLAETLYQGNPDKNHNLWNIVSTERDILHMQVLASAPLHYQGDLVGRIVLRVSLPIEGSSSLIHDI
jgi:hypothetical protein